ncbi:uncharacterized protein LOC113333603 [Papaver somniferum]|uniref:uncharacterized protein LOC113333603 n=1 Tax=Papaver somniferum TaxID=3469 RepID=UPI000E6F823C|nr:uncharacterized protein LOC113333603 [Papaver somniferum]
MRVFYWNTQGLAKYGARSKLHELYFLHKPGVICIAEPHVFCSVHFVRSLELVDFCEDVITNEVDGEKGNVWILWRNTLFRPDILSTSKQEITVNFAGDFITAVHASYNLVVRKRLWRQLGLGFISIPWLVLGDFNYVLCLEEKKGGRPIKEVYMNEFRSWISDNGLVEADAIGKKYTWSNYRSGAQRIVSKHDRAVVNDAWCYKYANWRCKAFPRVCSDHPTLFGFAFENPRPARVPFRIQKMWLSHPGFMQLVEENWSLDLNGAPPFHAELKLETENDLLDYDLDDEFQFLRVADTKKNVDDDEIKDFIVNHYQAKFNGGDVHIDPVLFDIEHESISVTESAYMDDIPSLEEVRVAVFDLGADYAPGPDGFTGSFYRQCWDIISRDLFNEIANCWIITKIMATRLGTVLNNMISEEQVAFMNGRNIHENIALASEFINEINTEKKHGNVGLKLDISQAFDTISVMINGCPEGYFSITRGLRQGDPLSPLIFVLIEDVLSRNLSKLFANHSMNVMVNKKGVAPTHLLFADDILIFCRGNLHSLQNFKNMLVLYERASGQCVNYAKSKFYFGGDRIYRAISISNYLGMERTMFPDKYLGIQLKPGMVRHIHVRQVVENIMDKLDGWKGKLLSFQARLVLIKSVISSYVIHSMVVYKCPCTVIKQVERAIRNFHWSGDAEKLKYFTVLYDDLCLPKREGGLGIKKLNDVNRSMLMKLWIYIKILARFLKAKYFKINGNLINYKLGSSVFPGICLVYYFVQKHTCSIIDLMIRCNIDVENLPVIAGGEDYKIWDLDSKGVFLVKSAKVALKMPAEFVPCANLFTRQVVHPTLSVQYWKIWAKQCCASEENIIKKTGRSMPTMCRLCRKSCETLSHITLHCRVARRIWAWVAGIFKLDPSEDLVDSYKAAKGRSRMIKDMWLVANLAIVTELWKLRNKSYFDNMFGQWPGFKGRVYQIMQNVYPIEISWNPPNQDEIMICCDGASFGNPDQAGSGVVFHDANSEVLGVLCIGLGWKTNFYAEVCAIIYGAIMAKRWNMRSICIRSDSKSCIQAFQKGELPLQLVQKWKIAKSYYTNVRYIHSYREVNLSADASTKQACLLAEDIFEFFEGRQGFIPSVKWPGRVYYRFN